MSTPESEGIDAAWPQGARYDWAQWAGTIGFGMCKATEGTTILDPDLGANWNAMWELDHLMPRFAYHEYHPGTSALAQAQHFVTSVQQHGLLPGDNLVLALDDITDGLPPAEVAARAVQTCHIINGLAPGHRVLAYANPSFAAAGNCAGLAPWFLWIADYGVMAPTVPKPWTNWTFWQRGNSTIDTDVFHGTADQLRIFTRMPSSR